MIGEVDIVHGGEDEGGEKEQSALAKLADWLIDRAGAVVMSPDQLVALATAFKARGEEMRSKDVALSRRNREVAELRDRVRYLVEARTEEGLPAVPHDHLMAMLERASDQLHEVVAVDAPSSWRVRHHRESLALAAEIDRLLAKPRPVEPQLRHRVDPEGSCVAWCPACRLAAVATPADDQPHGAKT